MAQRQGQAAARNMLGQGERFDAVPFFWSQHYDVAINYVGHAERWDRIEIDGDARRQGLRGAVLRGGRVLAVATLGRDQESLVAEVELEGEAGSGERRRERRARGGPHRRARRNGLTGGQVVVQIGALSPERSEGSWPRARTDATVQD